MMDTLVAPSPAARETDPINERYFTMAAHTLDDHRDDSAHRCVVCGTAWPCNRVLAAAFVLELHTTDPAMA